MRRASGAVVCAAILLGAPIAPATTTIKGRLKPAGYVVNAVTPSGAAVSARPDAKGRFTLALPGTTGKGATLQLLGADGVYFGPVVLRHKGSRAYTALSGRSMNLGTLKVLDGWAVGRVAARGTDRSRWADAGSSGKPLGAGKLGLVATTGKVHHLRTAAEETSGGGADPDGDGIPNAYDADDDGDGILDNVDPDTAGAATVHTGYFLPFGEALNANAAGVTRAQIDAKFSGENRFGIGFWFFRFDGPAFAGKTITGAHVDCFGLPYCRKDDGTGILGRQAESPPELVGGNPWVAYDPDGSGYPNLVKMYQPGDAVHFVYGASVQPRVPTASIHPGDSYNVVYDTDGGDVTVAASLSAYFVTVPAVASYDAGAGPQSVTYPVPQGAPGTSTGAPIVMTGNRITIIFWRPQRAAISGAESGDFIDMGRLHYGVPVAIGNTEFGCPLDYSNLGGGLTLGTHSSDTKANELFPLTDANGDAAPDPARTLSFTIDLGACLDRNNVPHAGLGLNLTLTASGEPGQGGSDRASQMIAVQLP